jgi:hypothetical protein
MQAMKIMLFIARYQRLRRCTKGDGCRKKEQSHYNLAPLKMGKRSKLK